MASEKHDFIVSAIVRKIRQDGFKILYLDGKYQDIDSNKYSIPPKIINHKPDIVAIKEDEFFCIGEAKTTNDIFSKRTKNQIRDFLSLVRTNPQNKLFLGVPLKAKDTLHRLLLELDLHQDGQIETIYIPEGLFPSEKIRL